MLQNVVPGASYPKIRCSLCNRKVGINGFECRCQKIFCTEHRFQYVHNCEVDPKSISQEKIAKENKVVITDKMIRI
jgi:hypothetical protein